MYTNDMLKLNYAYREEKKIDQNLAASKIKELMNTQLTN